MVGAGPDCSTGSSSAARTRGGTSIPPLSLRRALEDSLTTSPACASLSAALPTRRRAGRVGKKGKVTGRGGGRGRSRRTVASSSPPPPTHSREQKTTMVDPFEEEATGTSVHETRMDRHSAHESPVQDQPRVEVPLAHETRIPEATSQETPVDMLRPTWRGSDGVPGRIGPRCPIGPRCRYGPRVQVAVLLMAGMSLRIVRAMCRCTGPPCTSVIVHASRSCRLPVSRGR